MGNKLTQVSFLFVFATLLVVIGHADITLDYKDLWIHKWVYSFHMPLFFLVSGFLFAYTHPENKMKGMRFFPFIWKKVKRLLLPFLFINSVIFVIKSRFVSADLMQHPLTFSFSSWVESLLFHPIGFMCFLPALLMIFVFFSLLRKWICVNIYLQMGGVILLFVLSRVIPDLSFMQISSAVHYSVYFGLGILYCIYKGRVDAILSRYRGAMLLGSFVLSAGLIPVKVMAALVGIAFSLTLSLSVEKHCGDRMIRLSGFTYTVFLLSYFPQMFIRGPIAHALPEVNQYVLSLVSIVMGFGLPMVIGFLYARVRNKNRLTRFVGLLIGV